MVKAQMSSLVADKGLERVDKADFFADELTQALTDLKAIFLASLVYLIYKLRLCNGNQFFSNQ